MDTNSIQFAEDALRIGDTYFKLVVKVITGQITECVLKVSVTDNWHDLTMRKNNHQSNCGSAIYQLTSQQNL